MAIGFRSLDVRPLFADFPTLLLGPLELLDGALRPFASLLGFVCFRHLAPTMSGGLMSHVFGSPWKR